MTTTPQLLGGICFALLTASLVQLYHWQKILRVQRKKKKTYATGANILVDLMIVLCSAGLGSLGVMLLNPPLGYLASAIIGIAPFPTLQALWKFWGPKPPSPSKPNPTDRAEVRLPPSLLVKNHEQGPDRGARPLGGDFDFGQARFPGDEAGPPLPLPPEHATFGEFLNPET